MNKTTTNSIEHPTDYLKSYNLTLETTINDNIYNNKDKL